MKRGRRGVYTVVLVMVFLVGMVLVILPILTELESYREDADEYATIASQIHSSQTQLPSVIHMPLHKTEPAWQA